MKRLCFVIILLYCVPPLNNLVIDPNDYVTYQVILETTTGCGLENGKIKVLYNYDECGSTFINNYNNNNLNGLTVGIQNSDGTIGLQYRRSESNLSVTVPGPLFGSPLAVEFAPINSVLPVELASFISSVSQNDVRLIWVVNSQLNNSGFDIERSIVNDPTSDEWTKIGNVSGNGTTTNTQQYSCTDKNLSTGKYKYRLKQIDYNGSFKYYDLQNEVVIGVALKYNLEQNYPNPFNPVTRINYDIAANSKVTLTIYDAAGRQVNKLVNEFKTAGYYSVDFNGINFASGVYFYKLEANAFIATKRMILLK